MSLEHPGSRRDAPTVWMLIPMLLAFGDGVGCSSNNANPSAESTTMARTAQCMTGIWSPQVTGRTLAFDILPPADSPAARTEMPAVTVGGAPISLVADDEVVAAGGVKDDESFYPATKAHLVAITPSLIPGQDDLRLVTDMAGHAFMLSFARGRIGSSTTVWLFPGAIFPGQPPIPIAATLDVTMPLVFPRSEQLTTVRGILHDSLDNPLQGFIARAYAGTNVISNAVMTGPTGMFQLLFAPASVPADENGMIAIHADPPLGLDPVTMNPVPRFETQLVPIATLSASTNQTFTFKLPAFAQPAPLRFAVQDSEAVGIPDVSVRFRTEIPALSDGTAIYEIAKTTNLNGEFEVPLIPGTANSPVNYQVSLAPALDAPYSAICVPNFPVTMVGSGTQPQYSSPVLLGDRVNLLGTVLNADGLPAVGVMVTATPISGTSGCFNSPSTTPVSTTTKRDGAYLMLLDAGTYRLDIDPPLGAPLPRLTQEGDLAVTVSQDTSHDIMLPRGEVVEGTLTASDGTLLIGAGIKIFEVMCQGDTCQGPSRIPPVLRAQTSTDAKGAFSVVLPTP